MIDTHAHLYLNDFSEDLNDVLGRATEAGITEIWLPGIDADSLEAMEHFRERAGFRLFAGLHPCDVKDDFRQQLSRIRQAIDQQTYDGIGEIGIDLYWDKTFFAQQQEAFTTQLDWALERNQPALIHVRDAFDETLELVRPYYGRGLKAVFHSFAGTLEQALELTGEGFYLGINGTITFKNSKQALFLSEVPLSQLLTETDAPFLSPVPHRGKRNESAHIPLIVAKLAEIYQLPAADIATQTAANAERLIG